MADLHRDPVAHDIHHAAIAGGSLPTYTPFENFPIEPYDAPAIEPGYVEGVAVDCLGAGAVVIVQTQNSTYHLEILDPESRHALMAGGRHFPEATEVRVEGSTAGGNTLRMGWIGVGLQLEIASGRGRMTTSRVESVQLHHAP